MTTITIKSTGPDNTPLEMKHGEQVTFVLDSYWSDPVPVTIDFGSSSPFSQTTFQLGGNQQLSQTKTVLANADIKQYSYSVTYPSSRQGGSPVLTSTPSGEIDVSSGW
jgi:hypothetical protein